MGGELRDWTAGRELVSEPELPDHVELRPGDLEKVGNANIFEMRFQVDF